MREIKFRAWHELSSRMIIPSKGFELKDGVLFSEEWILLQFTGIKDKNGKEIYEGDLFDCIYKFDGCKKHKLAVYWNEASASFRLKGYGVCLQPNVNKTVGDLYCLEVIGNIYENPELLKD